MNQDGMVTRVVPIGRMLEIVCNDPAAEPRAKHLAALAGLPMHRDLDIKKPHPVGVEARYLLVFDSKGVSLMQCGPGAAGPIRAEFAAGAANHRRHYGGGTGQLIARAVGIKGGRRPGVLDATAGLGGDAFVLATLGCEVLLIERSPIVHALLADGLARARGEALPGDGLAEVLARMSVRHDDALAYLQALPRAAYPDVVYLDPMFPERTKSASVKKAMRAFHDLVGRDTDAAQLLALALERVRYRVVVKRPRKAPALEGPAPTYALEGKSGRYDIYALRKIGD